MEGLALAVMMLAVLVVAGCGGGGDSPDDGPVGPQDWTLPQAMALATAAAPAAGARQYQDAMAGWEDENNIPSDQEEMQDELNRWCDAVEANPNDAAAQLGLSMVILAMSGDNAAQDLGYDLFAELDLQAVASVQFNGDLTPETVMADSLATTMNGTLPKIRGLEGVHPAQAGGKNVTAQDLVGWQNAIATHLLPALENVLQRARAIADNADPATALVSYTDGGDETYTVHAADFAAMAALMDLIYSPLLEISAVNVNYGSFEWDRDITELDANDDGVLTTDEYLPARPFLDINEDLWDDAGAALRDCVARLIQAIDGIPADPDDLLNRAVGDSDLTNLRESLVEVGEMLAGEITVSVELSEWEDPAPADWINGQTTDIRMNMREMWDSPPDNLRDLMPQLIMVPNKAIYTVPGLPNNQLQVWLDDWNPGTEQMWLWLFPFTDRDDSQPITLGPGPHEIAFGPPISNTPVDLEFNALWTTVSGTLNEQPIAANLESPDAIDYQVIFRWSDLPDESFSGLFPAPNQVDALFPNWIDRYVLTYGDTVRLSLDTTEAGMWLPAGL
jgi:hypothetical protein